MVRKHREDDDGNAGITGGSGDETDRNRRTFLKLVGTAAVASGIGGAAVGSGAAAGGDPFTYVESVVLDGGYPQVVSQDEATAVVRSGGEFIDAVGSASSGDVVFVPGDAKVDLSGEGPIEIPGGVTVASDRGVNGSAGGLIFSDVKDLPLLRTGGSGVRLTSLRLRGNHPEGYHEFTEWNESANGLKVDHANAEVDNCEIFGWGYAGVVAEADGCHVHHCHVHANEEDGLGYGVHCLGGHTTIEYNYFLHNRHAIAGGGSEPGYTARYNLVGPKGDDHAFDMHEPGGNRIIIHHNKFEYDETIHGSPIEAVKIRGVPDEVCEIRDNWFHHGSPPGDAPVSEDGEAINQSGSDGEWGNLTFSSNHYGPDASPDYGTALLKQNDPVTGTSGGSGGSDGSTDDSTPSTRPFEVRTASDSGEVTYEFTADGEVSQAPDDVENNDDVTANGDGTWTATGSTGNGYSDHFRVAGDVTAFSATPAAAVTVLDDGTDVTDDLLGSDDSSSATRPLEIRTSPDSGSVVYEFTVDGELAQAPDDVERNDNVKQNDDGTWTATGFTGKGYDDVYEFSGSVVEFSASPAAAVTLYDDGTDITDEVLGSDMTHAIRFDALGSGGESQYSFEVSGEIRSGPGTTLEDADVISGGSVEGTLQDDVDVYHYNGDLVSFDFGGAMTVSVEDLD